MPRIEKSKDFAFLPCRDIVSCCRPDQILLLCGIKLAAWFYAVPVALQGMPDTDLFDSVFFFCLADKAF